MTENPEEYLRNGDYALALRRTLDLALDSNKPEIIAQATALSRKYREALAISDDTTAHTFTADARALLQQLPAPAANRSDNALVKINSISKTYTRGNFSLKPLSMQLKAGEITGVVGENGNGKTTLLRCIAGQLAIDSGSLEYAGLNAADHYAIKSAVAFIPQRIPRWYGRLRDNLHFSASLSGITGAENELLVDFMLERFGLSGYAGLTWNQISSGYRTRFEIARVLLMRPQVMILDEPLANLDINAQQTLLTDLRFLALSSARPLAVLLTSQQLHEVEKVAHRVLLIRQGSCIFTSDEPSAHTLGHALELETTSPRDAVKLAVQGIDAELSFNGGFFTLVSHTHTAQQLLKHLIEHDIHITYCRDISNSTKRLF
ncbi:MAG: ABC transporter ATP-binding protein [Bacteroidia bacterium]|jgi:ABC-2 type transport system ATP-binding protein|nr:ABC transporter ATP-binding protein [Bacteroidia bacterium]